MTQPTSAQTYYDIVNSGELGDSQRKVLQALIDWGAMTGSEINEFLGTSSGHKRLSELKAMGVVREGTPRACKVTGREAIEWVMTGQLPTPQASKPGSTPSRKTLEAGVQEIRALINFRKLYDPNYSVSHELYETGIWLRRKAKM